MRCPARNFPTLMRPGRAALWGWHLSLSSAWLFKPAPRREMRFEPDPAKLPDIFSVSYYDVFRLKLTYKASDIPILANGRLCMQNFRPKLHVAPKQCRAIWQDLVRCVFSTLSHLPQGYPRTYGRCSSPVCFTKINPQYWLGATLWEDSVARVGLHEIRPEASKPG